MFCVRRRADLEVYVRTVCEQREKRESRFGQDSVWLVEEKDLRFSRRAAGNDRGGLGVFVRV